MPLSDYKDIFGKVGEGAHSYRFMNLAVVDVLATLFGAWILARLFKWNFWYTLVGFFLLGIFLHHIFGVKTTIDKLLFSK